MYICERGFDIRLRNHWYVDIHIPVLVLKGDIACNRERSVPLYPKVIPQKEVNCGQLIVYYKSVLGLYCLLQGMSLK